MWVPTVRLLELIAAAAVNHTVGGNFSGPLYGAYLGVCIAPTPAFTQASVIGSITEATYTGYARQALTWGTTYQTAQQLQVLPAANLIYQPSDAVTPNVATGLFIADAITTGNLLAGLLFPGLGYPLGNANQAMEALARYGFDYAGNWGDAIIAA